VLALVETGQSLGHFLLKALLPGLQLLAPLLEALALTDQLFDAGAQGKLLFLLGAAAHGGKADLGLELAFADLELAGGPAQRLLVRGKAIAPLLVTLVKLLPEFGQLALKGSEFFLLACQGGRARFLLGPLLAHSLFPTFQVFPGRC